MAKKIIIGNADFSHNAIDIKHKLTSSMLTQGLIDAVPGTGIRPPSGGNDYMNRASLITNTALSEYSKVTIPSGMQWAATFFDENGDCVSTVNASWVKNQTGKVKTFNLSEANSYVSTAYYFHISFGYIDGSQLNVADFDTTVSIYLDKPEPIPEPTELRITSSMVEVGMLAQNGDADASSTTKKKRLCYRHQTFLSEFPRISIPNNIKFCVLYRDDENETVNVEDMLLAWTETPGNSGGGIVNITSAVKQDISLSPTATSYYLSFGKIASEGSSADTLTPEELDTTYEIKLLPPSND